MSLSPGNLNYNLTIIRTLKFSLQRRQKPSLQNVFRPCLHQYKYSTLNGINGKIKKNTYYIISEPRKCSIRVNNQREKELCHHIYLSDSALFKQLHYSNTHIISCRDVYTNLLLFYLRISTGYTLYLFQNSYIVKYEAYVTKVARIFASTVLDMAATSGIVLSVLSQSMVALIVL